ncbi:MAG: ABC transporter ATP-binding protein [Actinomycetota bacterium]|nr:ABC transporter ATP-binding protein [Actinomycetota bacterium]
MASRSQGYEEAPQPVDARPDAFTSPQTGGAATTESPVPAAAALLFSGVTHFYGEHRALDDLCLRVERGQTLALLGPNGAGKSTTISVLLGLVRPGAGEVEVLGRSPREAVASGRVGAMLQTGSGTGLPPGVRVLDVLKLVRRLYASPAALDVVIERAAVATLLHRRTDQLSGGQAQRVRFALAIAGDPDVVFLDEPTAAMDVEARRSFWKMIRSLGEEGRTTVFATHHLAEADQVADRVVVLHHGRVVADGPGATLKAAVASRQVRFVSTDPDLDVLNALEGVTDVQVRGTTVTLDSLDADASIRALVRLDVEFKDLEVTGAGLEEAFLALTTPLAAAEEDAPS